MKKLIEVMKTDFKKLTQEDWDNVLIIAGDEGISKSNLGLWMLDLWQQALKGKCEPEDADKICLNSVQFVEQLKIIEGKQMLIYDEAGELSNLRRMSKFNAAINLAYQIIRGRNNYTILILPSLFDMDAFFTKRRARAFIQVYKRGKFAFYNKKKLREIMDAYQRKKNQYTALRSVKPLFYDTFPKYEGVMAERYKQKKAERMAEVVKILEEKLGGLKNESKKSDDMDSTDNSFDMVDRKQQRNNRNSSVDDDKFSDDWV